MAKHKIIKKYVATLWILMTVAVSVLFVTVAYYLLSLRDERCADEIDASAPKLTAAVLKEEAEIYKKEDSAISPVGQGDIADTSTDYDYREILSDEDGILIARIVGKRYRGVIAVIDDPKRVYVASIPYYGDGVSGQTLFTMVERNNAVLGINGGGFDDSLGQGLGGNPQGVIITGGSMWLGYAGGQYDAAALDENGRLYCGIRTGQELMDLGIQNAVCFGPCLIVDGEIQHYSAANWEPRSAIGQREDGKIVMLALEGRQVAAQGADLETLANVMAEYGCVNATNLDGGASSALVYKGQLMNIANSVGGLRGIPTAILVAPLEEEY